MDIELTNRRVVAVDGGTATGKGRLCDELTQLLRRKGVPVLHISTGLVFRAVALAAIEHEQVPGDEISQTLDRVRQLSGEQLVDLAHQRGLEMHGGVIWLDGAATPEERLKGPGVGTGSSIVAGPAVRQLMVAITRRQINEFDGYVLIDGRDITHVVVPDAPLKLLLTVAPHIAAQRSIEHTEAEIVARDMTDRSRQHGALRHPDDPGEGVRVLSTDDHTPESVRDHVYELMREVFPALPSLA